MSASPDPDLRDVFKLLYADDDDADWAMSDEEDEVTANTSTSKRDLEAVEEDITSLHTARYTRKRFQSELESLFTRSSAKKARIFPPPVPAAPDVYTSLMPLPTLPSTDVYAPYSPLPLLARLRTYSRRGFTLLEAPLDAVTLARQGWIAVKADEVECGVCKARFSLHGLEGIRDVGVRREVVRRLGLGMKERHAADCAWRVRSCPDDLLERLRKTLHPIVSGSLAPLAQRLEEECARDSEIRWSSPLSEKQQSNLVASIARHLDTPPSSLAANMTWFAWYPYQHNVSSNAINLTNPASPTEIVHCRVCQRRVGLWAFKGKENESGKKESEAEFDLVQEHFSWCPIRQGSWWTSHPLLCDDSAEKGGSSVEKGWVKVSDRMEKKPWRRA